MPTTLEYLQSAIEFAPPEPGALAPDLAGWLVGPEVLPICCRCSGRIMARGGALPRPATPVYHYPEEETCCLCKETLAYPAPGGQ